jgi:polyphosphate:AMP phosphotransferase
MADRISLFESAELGRTIPKADFDAILPDLRVSLINAQYDLRRADFNVVLLIAGDDRLGIRDFVGEMGEWLDARHVRVHLFGPRTEEERAYPLAWRYWRAMPCDGETAVFIGGWSTLSIHERATGAIGEKEFERRCELVQRLEEALVADRTVLIKVWLHLPKKELKRRIAKIKKRDEKSWRIDVRDIELYEQYDELVEVAERFVVATDTRAAPWLIVESTDRHYRDLTIAHAILDRITERFEAKISPPARPAQTDEAQPANSAKRAVLGALDLSASLPDERYEAKLEQESARLAHLTRRARRKDVATVIVFEGWDAAGKGGTIRRLSRAIDLENQKTIAISAPSDQERAHHYLWRFWRQLPRDGTVAMFDRSWYGRVLVERVEGYAKTAEWTRAYDEINGFEAHLADHGVVIVKFWLHVSHDEQMRRFEEREATPYKKYKITAEDYRNRAKRPQYEAAVEDMVARTNTEFAPWHLVPANDKRFARIQVFEAVCAALEKRL